MNVLVSPPSPAAPNESIYTKLSGDLAGSVTARDSELPAYGVEADLPRIAVISQNRFFGTCFARCLAQMAVEFDIRSFASCPEWLQNSDGRPHEIVLLCVTGQRATEEALMHSMETILQAPGEPRVIIVSDIDQPNYAIEALGKGARGYVSMGLDLEVALGAIRLISVGGTFVPASSFMSMRGAPATSTDFQSAPPETSIFTGRQLEVLEHLRRGDPNKIIAHKTSMSEATVKIHVRNMMRKIKAKNRTELVCKSNELLGL